MRYYLSHPFDLRKEVREWELEFEKRVNIELFNPFYDRPREEVVKIDEGRLDRYKLYPKKIVLDDLREIKRCDDLITIIGGNGFICGTLQEMVYARLFGKRVYSLITNGHERHPWLRFHSTRIFTDRKDLENHLINLQKWGKKNGFILIGKEE